MQSNTLIQHSYFWSIWSEFTNICILRAQLGVTTSLAVPDAMVAPTSLSLEIAVSISPRRKYNPENQPPNFFQDQFRRYNLPRLHSTTAITKLCTELDRMPKQILYLVTCCWMTLQTVFGVKLLNVSELWKTYENIIWCWHKERQWSI